MKTIGYYVHHHGTGHMRRAVNVVSKMKSRVFLFSSAAEPSYLPENVTYIHLPEDKVEGYTPDSTRFFPYTPYNKAIFERSKLLIDTWQRYGIKHIHVDVSVEVAALAKLHGLSVSYTIMQGNRRDKSHTLAYSLSDFLLAFSTEIFDEKVRNTDILTKYVGGVSRFTKVEPKPIGEITRVAIITSPLAEKTWSNEIVLLAQDNKNIAWDCIGFNIETKLQNVSSHGKVADPHDIIRDADIVIGSSGNNTIMELSSLAKPFICIPEPRPYDEQISAARKLLELNAAIVLESFPKPNEWKDLVQNIKNLDLIAFAKLTNNDSSDRAAKILDDSAS
jgi:hypothetical protein